MVGAPRVILTGLDAHPRNRRNASMHTAIWSHPVLSRLPICRSGNGEWRTPKYRNNDSIHSLGCLRTDHFKKMLYSSPIMSFGGPEKKGRSSYKAVVHASSVKEDINGVDELEAGRRNPGLSGNYRPLTKLKPNATVLEAQGRICTGPTQTRPLNEQQAFKVLDTILQSGTLPPCMQLLVFPVTTEMYCHNECQTHGTFSDLLHQDFKIAPKNFICIN
jgi:hypothetical protein